MEIKSLQKMGNSIMKIIIIPLFLQFAVACSESSEIGEEDQLRLHITTQPESCTYDFIFDINGHLEIKYLKWVDEKKKDEFEGNYTISDKKNINALAELFDNLSDEESTFTGNFVDDGNIYEVFYNNDLKVKVFSSRDSKDVKFLLHLVNQTADMNLNTCCW